jgi:ankyrin repeat protein
MTKKLLEKGADPNMTDEFGRTVLHLVCNLTH